MPVAQDSRCLLLDEPTSALDIAHQVDVLALVHRLSRAACLTRLPSHDINMAARYCRLSGGPARRRNDCSGDAGGNRCAATLWNRSTASRWILATPGRCGAGKLCLLMMNPTLIARRRLLIRDGARRCRGRCAARRRPTSTRSAWSPWSSRR